MRKGILDKVMQDVLGLDYDTKIKYEDNKYIYNKDGLICTNKEQGYSCDFIAVGALLEGEAEIIDNIDYKQCWNDMKTFLKTNILCEGLKASVLLGNMKVWENNNEKT